MPRKRAVGPDVADVALQTRVDDWGVQGAVWYVVRPEVDRPKTPNPPGRRSVHLPAWSEHAGGVRDDDRQMLDASHGRPGAGFGATSLADRRQNAHLQPIILENQQNSRWIAVRRPMTRWPWW
jgi:hypothetical protein